MRFEKPEIVRLKINDETKVLFVASEIYLLSDKGPTEVTGARVLSAEEVDGLPVKLQFTGPPTDFSCSEEEFFQKLLSLIGHFNSRQDQDIVSFPLGAVN